MLIVSLMDEFFCLLEPLLEVVVLAGEGGEVLGQEVFLLCDAWWVMMVRKDWVVK